MVEKAVTTSSSDDSAPDDAPPTLPVKVEATKLSAEDLLDAANSASATARNAWLGFLLFLTYLVVTLASMTDEALLLNKGIKMPVIDVTVAIQAFFVFGPILLLVLHLGIVIQHVMLARKLEAFNAALGDPDHKSALRATIHSYVFSQLAAGPRRSPVLRGAMQLMAAVSLKASGLLVMIYFLVAALPLHDVVLAWWLRGVFVADLALVILVAGFLSRPSGSFWQVLSDLFGTQSISTYFRFVVYPAAIFIVFFVATVPDEWADEVAARLPWTVERSGRPVFAPTAWLLEGNVTAPTYERTSPFSRNYDLRSFDFRPLAPKQNDAGSEVKRTPQDAQTVEKRPRLPRLDLRYALLSGAVFRGLDLKHVRLDRAVLFEADLQGADLANMDLEGVDFRDADLSGARLDKSNLTDVQFAGAQLRGAYLVDMDLKGVDFSEVDLSGANLDKSDLTNVQFASVGSDPTSQQLEGAQLQGTGLSGANLQGLDLAFASLQGADLSRAKLQGSDLSGAQLQGADMHAAKLHGADLSGAELHGAVLVGAQLQGADLTLAELEGVLLLGAQLQGADLSGAVLQGAIVHEAEIWLTDPPEKIEFSNTDLRGLGLSEPSHDEIAELAKTLDGIADKSVRADVEVSLKTLFDATERKDWADSSQYTTWKTIKGRPRPAPAKVCSFFVKLACSEDDSRHVAKNIAQVALIAVLDRDYRPYAPLLARALLQKSCKGVSLLSTETKVKLLELASKASGAECKDPQDSTSHSRP